jgi:hypothetical protein
MRVGSGTGPDDGAGALGGVDDLQADWSISL